MLVSPYRSDMRHVTREEMAEIDRRSEQEFGVPVATLMENAGAAVAEEAERLVSPGSRVVVVCGRGNNGGDGLVAARILVGKGYSISLRLVGFGSSEGLSPLVEENLRRAREAAVREEKMENADLVIDALFGTGLKRPVEGEARQAVEWMNRQKRPVLSVDIPTGLDANEGVPLGVAVRASSTVTMGLPKVGFRNPDSRSYTGEIRVAEIGFPPDLVR